MSTYVTMLRGVMPTNPNTRSEKLREVFEALGFKKVETVIGSGNIVFQSSSKSERALETKIEKELLRKLGFKTVAIVRSKEDLVKLQKKNPFKVLGPSSNLYTVITFLKDAPATKPPLPYKGEGYTMLSMFERSIAIAIDLKNSGTPDVMRVLEKKFSKDITTRTWKTIERILKKMEV